MSASLVGSEMCIRDRFFSRSLARCCNPTQEQICPRSHDAAWHPRRRPPVSYTHLTLPTICSV
eukprot:4979733-Alexandrium_andersonii.AAC.1